MITKIVYDGSVSSVLLKVDPQEPENVLRKNDQATSSVNQHVGACIAKHLIHNVKSIIVEGEGLREVLIYECIECIQHSIIYDFL